jgi:hypothetical protein
VPRTYEYCKQKCLNQDEEQQVIVNGIVDTVIHADQHRNVI